MEDKIRGSDGNECYFQTSQASRTNTAAASCSASVTPLGGSFQSEAPWGAISSGWPFAKLYRVLAAISLTMTLIIRRVKCQRCTLIPCSHGFLCMWHTKEWRFATANCSVSRHLNHKGLCGMTFRLWWMDRWVDDVVMLSIFFTLIRVKDQADHAVFQSRKLKSIIYSGLW